MEAKNDTARKFNVKGKTNTAPSSQTHARAQTHTHTHIHIAAFSTVKLFAPTVNQPGSSLARPFVCRRTSGKYSF